MPWQRSRPENDDESLLPGPPTPPRFARRDDGPPEPLDPAHRDAVLEGLDQTRRGEVASEGEVAALYRRAGL